MPNPNYCEMRLIANYGEDAQSTTYDGQGTRIYPAVSDDSDEIDHKLVKEVYLGGKYVELAHYASVKQVVVQNISEFWGIVFYVDATTGALVPDNVESGEHVTINNPDVTAGIMLYSRFILEASKWHLAICGRKD